MKAIERRRKDVSERRRSNVDAERLGALWRISQGTADGSEVSLASMLAEGAAVLRPGQPFAAQLSRAEDGQLDVDATRSWDDVRTAASDVAIDAARSCGVRALIATPVRVGPTRYTISFASQTPLEEPFDTEDRAFVEIFAGYVERALQQRWQSERLNFQIQHDALTGLINRSHFRAHVRAALEDGGSCGLVIVDVAYLRELNERLGYQTGDALLVEVGATLAAMNRDGEFTGRLHGGMFGIGFPRVASRITLERRVEAYARLFDRPFSTGDRARAEWIPLSATFGLALAPVDAHAPDDLIAKAVSALTAR
jgi:diguanylate cyclase (GGDEF)-like protein